MAKKIASYLLILVIAFVIALNYQMFVFPNNFAPAGLNGLFTMLQHTIGFKLSNSSLILNVPLVLYAYLTGFKTRAIRSFVYTLAFSLFLNLLDKVDLSAFVYSTTISTLLGPAVAGLITGFCGYIMHRMNAGYGGTELIAALVHRKKPNFNFFNLLMVLNVSVALISYFVYGYQIEPVLLCIVYCYFSSSTRDRMDRSNQSAMRCEIITNQPKELGDAIIHTLHHSATVLEGAGLYSGQAKAVLICIVNPSQLSALTKLVGTFPDSFVIISQVHSVVGNFKRLNSQSQPKKELFDAGTK